jgi:hypothetical protein
MRALVVLFITACAGSTPPPRETDRISPSLDSAIEESVRANEVARTHSRRMTTPKNMEVRRIGEPDRPLPPLGRRARVNVRFKERISAMPSASWQTPDSLRSSRTAS